MKPINSERLNRIRTGFKALYDSAFGKHTPQWNVVAMEVLSQDAAETYAWLGQTTQFREWLGDRVIQNLAMHDYTIKNKDYENTIAVDRNAIHDDKLGVYSPMLAMMGQTAATHPDELVYGLMKLGFTSTCYDGQFFFDTDHPVVDANGVTQSVANTDGGAGPEWFLVDDSKAIKPIIKQKRTDYNFQALDNPDDPNVFMKKTFIYGVDARGAVGFALWQLAWGSKQSLTAANFETGFTSMMKFTGDNGKPLGITPKKLIVGPSNLTKAEAIVKAKTLANGAENTNQGKVEIVLVPWLS